MCKFMSNSIKSIRLAKKLTQEQLAKLVGTSQQQIQRIETGAIAARLDIVMKLGQALGESVNSLFPGSDKALNKMRIERKNSKYLELDSWSDVRSVGVEPDARIWSLKIGIAGYIDPFLFYDVPAADKNRVFSNLQFEENLSVGTSFVVFDSATHRIAIKVRELTYCHFLFDAPPRQSVSLAENPANPANPANPEDEQDEEDEEDDDGDYDSQTSASIYVIGGGAPLVLTLNEDRPESADLEEMGQCQTAFYELDTECEPTHKIFLTDADGEEILIRAGNLALFMVPLQLLDTVS